MQLSTSHRKASSGPQADPDALRRLEEDRAARHLAWLARRWRGDARTALERLDQLRGEGRVFDEAYFAQLEGDATAYGTAWPTPEPPAAGPR